MKRSTACVAGLLLLLGACNGEQPQEDGQTGSQSDLSSTATSGELWDTDLTFGYASTEPASGLARGEQAYIQWCAICHEAGVGMAGTDSLRRTYQRAGLTDMSPILSERTDLAPAYVELVVRNGIKSMPNFRKTEISDEDLALIGAYLGRNNPDLGGE